MGRIDEMTSGDEQRLCVWKGLGEAVVHPPQGFRGVLRGDDQGWLAYPGQLPDAEVEGFLAQVESSAPDLRQDRGAGPP